MVNGKNLQCDCIPKGTKSEVERMNRYFAGEDVEGFPPHDNRILYGYDRFQEPEGYMPSVSAETIKAMRGD